MVSSGVVKDACEVRMGLPLSSVPEESTQFVSSFHLRNTFTVVSKFKPSVLI